MVEHLLIRRRYGRAGVILVAGAALLGAACGDDDESASPTTSEPGSLITTAGTTSTTAVDDDARVRAAYEAASRAFVEAAAIPDPNHPALVATHTGAMLEQSRQLLRALKADGRIIRYPPNTRFRIEVRSVEVDGAVARLTYCAVDDGERVVTRTGEVIASGVSTVEGRAAMQLDGTTWKLAEQLIDSREEGVATCGGGG